MSDNTTITPGTGATVAADLISGALHQRVKISLGADGTAADAPGDSGNGMDVDVTRLPALVAGTANIGDVDVLTLPALPAGTNNIGDVDVLTVPADPFGANADAAVAAGAVGSIQAKLRRLTTDIDAIKTSVAAATPAGTNNIGDVDVLTLPALVAGTANIGDVDVLTLPADPLGANADAAATAGSTGSFSAKFRLMTTQLDAIQTSLAALDNAIAGSEMQVDIVSGSSAGTEYTEGGTDATITGTAIMWEDTGDTLRAVSAAKPLPVNIASGTILLSGEDHIGSTGYDSAVIMPTITVSTSGYVAGDIVGGIITLTNAMRVSGGSGRISDLTIVDTAGQKPALDILLFNASPSGGTYTNNGALTLATADDAKIVGVIEARLADYLTVGARSVATIHADLLVKASGSQDLFALAVIPTGAAAPTFAASTNLHLAFAIARD